MTDVAAGHLEVLVDAHAQGRQERGFAWFRAYLRAFFFGDFSGASFGHIVVRYKTTGQEVLSIDSGTPDEADALRARIEQDLAQLPLSTFLEEWNTTTP